MPCGRGRGIQKGIFDQFLGKQIRAAAAAVSAHCQLTVSVSPVSHSVSDSVYAWSVHVPAQRPAVNAAHGRAAASIATIKNKTAGEKDQPRDERRSGRVYSLDLY